MSATLHLTSSERHSAAPWPNEKQSEETGNNPRQAPAGCHKKRGCLSSLSLMPSALTLWADERSMGRLGSRCCACCPPLHQEASQLQNTRKKRKNGKTLNLCDCELSDYWKLCVCFHVISYMLSLACCSQTYFQEMLNVSSLWIVFQTHFNPRSLPTSPTSPTSPSLTPL